MGMCVCVCVTQGMNAVVPAALAFNGEEVERAQGCQILFSS